MTSHTRQLPSTTQFVDRLIAQLSKYKPNNEEDTYQPSQSHTKYQNPLSSLPPTQLSKAKPLLLTLHCLFPNELLLALDILDQRLIRRFVTKNKNKDDAIAKRDDSDININMTSDDNNNSNINGDNDNTTTKEDKNKRKNEKETFFVISTSSGPREEDSKAYEVRLHAWNCTCPNFTLSAFAQESSDSVDENNNNNNTKNENDIPGSDPATDDPEPGIKPEIGPPAETETETEEEEALQNNSDDLPGVVESPSLLSPEISSHYYYYYYPFGGSLTRDTVVSQTPPLCKHLLACVLAVRCPALFGGGVEERDVGAGELGGWCAGWAG